MLNNLYRKLHILFASSVMLIITLVIAFVVANMVHTEKINKSTLFQRLTTLLIYQVESAGLYAAKDRTDAAGSITESGYVPSGRRTDETHEL